MGSQGQGAHSGQPFPCLPRFPAGESEPPLLGIPFKSPPSSTFPLVFFFKLKQRPAHIRAGRQPESSCPSPILSLPQLRTSPQPPEPTSFLSSPEDVLQPELVPNTLLYPPSQLPLCCHFLLTEDTKRSTQIVPISEAGPSWLLVFQSHSQVLLKGWS